MPRLSRQLREALATAGRTQQDIALRLDKAPPRISEFLRGLERAQPQRDRLTLLVEMADALGLTLTLVPSRKLDRMMTILGETSPPMKDNRPDSVFDEVFIDLAGDGDDEDASAPPPVRRR